MKRYTIDFRHDFWYVIGPYKTEISKHRTKQEAEEEAKKQNDNPF